MNSPHPSGSRDYERAFYTVLDDALDSDALPRADDFVKITDGPQAVRMADGNVAVLLTFKPDGIELLLNSCQHMFDHECPAGLEFAKFLAFIAGNLVVQLE